MIQMSELLLNKLCYDTMKAIENNAKECLMTWEKGMAWNHLKAADHSIYV